MKVLYAIRSIKHFPYHSPILRALWEQGHTIRLYVCPKDKQLSGTGHGIAEAIEESKGRLSVGDFGFLRPATGSAQFLTSLRELRSYAGYLRRPDQSVFYLDRYRGYLVEPWPEYLRSSWFVRLMKSPLFDTVCREIEDRTEPHPVALQKLNEEKPDIVVASPANMRYSREVEFLKAAKKLGIPTVIPVLSWDNLTTKGLLPVIPDRVLAWNEEHRQQAIDVHGVPKKKIRVTGAPFFDRWFAIRKAPAPERPFLLYLGSSANIAKNEGWLVLALRDALKKSRLKDFDLVVRPHPANVNMVPELKAAGITVRPEGGALPDSPENVAEFEQSLAQAAATVGINTSGMIDALVMDRPCVAVITDEYRKTQIESEHFRELRDSQAVYLPKGVEEAVKQLEEICLDGRDTCQPARRKFISHFIRPRGDERPAGWYAAEEIVQCVSR